jgi:hypothetical protein
LIGSNSPDLTSLPLSIQQQKGKGRQMSNNLTSCEEPYFVEVQINKPFHFSTILNPPPPSSGFTINNLKQGPPKIQYQAFTSDGGPLPDWLHFDSKLMEIWGTARSIDVGIVTDIIILRKTHQEPLTSPTKRGSGFLGISSPTGSRLETIEEERIVGRYVVEVIDHFDQGGTRRSFDFEGDIAIATY